MPAATTITSTGPIRSQAATPTKRITASISGSTQPAFVAPAAGELGDAARVPVVGPDFVNSDFSVIKDFPLAREGMGLNFRAEFFNLFNHPEFGSPVNDINAAGFGAVNSTVNNPRLIQLALKLTF